MKKLNLSPNQIIALNDSQLYSQTALKKYFNIFKKSKKLPFCPVIHKSKGIPYFKGKNKKSLEYNNQLKKFIKKHPKAKYFLLDGNHKTTAATLLNKKILAISLENKDNIKILKKKFGWCNIGNSISKVKENLSESLFKYYSKTFGFSTVEEKTKKLIKNKEIPRYMIRT